MKLIQDLQFGFRCAFQGIPYLFRHTSLLRLAAIPIMLNIGLFMGLIWLIYSKLGDLLSLLVSKPEAWIWLIFYYILMVLAFLLILILGTFLLCLIGNILAAPFHEWMSEKVRELEIGKKEERPFSFKVLFQEGKRIIGTQIKKLSFILFLEVLVLLFIFIPVVGTVLSGALTLILLAFQFIDFPLEIERLSVQEQRNRFLKFPGAWLGFGAGISILLAIPILNFLILPAGVVGASLLYYRRLL